MADSHPVKTPMDSLNVSLDDCPLPGSTEHHEMASIPYQEACSALMALATQTRPDILYSVMNLGLLPGHLSTPLFTDNAASMALSKFHMTTPRAKHLDSKFHLVRQEADSGAIQLQRVDTTTNVSDIFTKPLSVTLFYRHRAALGLC